MKMTHSAAKLAFFHLYTVLDFGILPYGLLYAAIVLVASALAFRAAALNIKSKFGRVILYLLILSITLSLWSAIYADGQKKAWRKFCLLYMRAGAVRAAEECLNKLEGVKAYPTYCHYMRGMAAHKNGQFQEAARRFTIVIDREKNNLRAWQNLVQCLISAKRLEDAEKRLKEAHPYLDPVYPGTQLLLELRLLLAKGNRKEARKVANKAVEGGLLATWQIEELFK